jgi:HAD superfamily hydrolase (TIGR01509 family)
MTEGVLRFRALDVTAVEVLLCDADGCLFPSEEPAFAASTAVMNRLLESLGVNLAFTPEALRRRSTGRNFRRAAAELVAEAGRSISDEALERWVAEERSAVTAHLAGVLRPDATVQAALRLLAGRMRLALVSSSALARLDASLRAAGLDALFAPEVRFSAEDSLAVPTSKPDPAIYAWAAQRLGVGEGVGLAVEDAAAGARSAVAAGLPTVGILQFVEPGERVERVQELAEAGVAAVVETWADLAALLTDVGPVAAHAG